ncbi:MAG: glycosyltransferase [Solirubrobacterales bacterium]
MAYFALASGLVGASGGGIGTRLTALADQLSVEHRVSLIVPRHTRESLEARYAGNDSVLLRFIPDPLPDDVEGFHSDAYHWSMRIYRAVRELCAEDPPDLVEFADYAGEGAVTVQARHTGDPLLAGTAVVLWLASSWEMVDVLDGFVPDDRARRITYALERYALAFADAIAYTGTDILRTYTEFYGADQLAPAIEYPQVITYIEPSSSVPTARPGDPLRMLYIGRFERRKGVLDLVRALALAPFDGWTLTLAGADTYSGSLETSMRQLVAAAAGDDPRIALLDAVEHEEIPALVDAHDVVISPSIWECGPNTVTEALARNRAVLATPVGGHLLTVIEGQSGMLAGSPGAEALEQLVRRAVEQRDELRELMRAEGPRERFRELGENGDIADQFLRAAVAGREARGPIDPPLVTVVVPYYRMGEYVVEAVESALAQSWSALEVVIVRDGSFFEEDAVLDRWGDDPRVRVLAKRNGGVGSARNFGAIHAEGEFIMFLDADNRLHPEFVSRSLAAFAADPEAVYITSNMRLIDAAGEPLTEAGPGFMIGSFPRLSEEINCSGDAMSMFRRSVFDRGFRYDEEMACHEDWEIAVSLRRAGLFGHAIPERLLDYRVRDGSMLRSLAASAEGKLIAERDARDRARQMSWKH